MKNNNLISKELNKLKKESIKQTLKLENTLLFLTILSILGTIIWLILGLVRVYMAGLLPITIFFISTITYVTWLIIYGTKKNE